MDSAFPRSQSKPSPAGDEGGVPAPAVPRIPIIMKRSSKWKRRGRIGIRASSTSRVPSPLRLAGCDGQLSLRSEADATSPSLGALDSFSHGKPEFESRTSRWNNDEDSHKQATRKSQAGNSQGLAKHFGKAKARVAATLSRSPSKWSGVSTATLRLHDTVIAVAISPDDKLIAAGCMDKVIAICSTHQTPARSGSKAAVATPDANSKVPILASVFAKGAIASLQFCCGGQRLVSGTMRQSMLELWDVSMSSTLSSSSLLGRADVVSLSPVDSCKFGDGNASLEAMAVTKSGSILVVAGKSTTPVVVYDVLKSIHKLFSVVMQIPAVAVSCCSEFRMMAVASSDKTVSLASVVWAATEPTEITWKGKFRTSAPISSVCASHDGTLLAVRTSLCTEVYSIHTSLNALSFGPLLKLSDQPTGHGSVAFAPGGVNQSRRLVSGSADSVSVIDFNDGGTVRSFRSNGRVRCVAISKLGQFVVFGGFDKLVHMRALDHGCNVHHFDNPGVVKSVHLSADSERLAVGCDNEGRGCVRYFDTLSGELLQSWDHPKEIWSVRISPNRKYLAAAGYEAVLYLYNLDHLELMQMIGPYKSSETPAYVWSVAWSLDSSTLVVACWNSFTYLYHIGHWGRLQEVARVWRSDRVYSVALDETGSHVAIGGRDKMAGLYRLENRHLLESSLWSDEQSRFSESQSRSLPSNESTSRVHLHEPEDLHELSESSEQVSARHEARDSGGVRCKVPTKSRESVAREYNWDLSDEHPHSHVEKSASHVHTAEVFQSQHSAPPRLVLLWMTRPIDFVYSVALSFDLQYLVYGGMDKCVHVHDGKTGDNLFDIFCTGPVWAVTLYDVAGTGDMIGYCGEFGSVSFVKDDGTLGIELPSSSGIVFDVCVSERCICHTNGSVATILGGAGFSYGWRDMPSGSVAASLILANKSSDAHTVRCFGHMVEMHPYLVNQRLPDGMSLLEISLTYSPRPLLVSILLNASCRLGMTSKLLDAVILSGKRRIVRQILEALCAVPSKYAYNVRAMLAFSEILEKVAVSHPQEFLDLMKNVPLVEEPEILQGTDTSDVLLHRRYTRGSSARTPWGLWREELAANRHRKDRDDEEELSPQVLESLSHESMEESHTLQHVEPQAFVTVEPGDPVQAMRIPFEHFAGGFFDSQRGRLRVSPMRLVVHAVEKTREFEVFDASDSKQIVPVVMQFKWDAFGHLEFRFEFFQFICRLVTTNAKNYYTILTVDLSLRELGESHPVLFALYVLSLISVLFLVAKFAREIRVVGYRRVLSSPWKCLDLVLMIGQLSIDIMFMLRDTSLKEIFMPSAPDMNSPIVLLISLVLLACWLRTLYYFRGVLVLGAFVHTLFSITKDLKPILFSSLAVMVSFDAAFAALLIHFYDGDSGRAFQAVATTSNYALRLPTLFAWTPGDTHEWPIIVLFDIYVALGQLFLLNLLIGVVAAANMRVRAHAAKVANFERAKFSLDKEQYLLDRRYPKATRKQMNKETFLHKAVGAVETVGDTVMDSLLDVIHHESRSIAGAVGARATLQKAALFIGVRKFDISLVCPRFLHVLSPASPHETVVSESEMYQMHKSHFQERVVFKTRY